jgi:Zn-finger nucleic acid-binding protein
MKKIDGSKCPLCDVNATFDFRDRKNIRFFHCGTCGDFFISRSAINWLNKKEPHRKAHFARLSASLKSKDNILEFTIVVGWGLHVQQVPRTRYPE